MVSTLLEKFGQIGSSPQIEATKKQTKYLKLPRNSSLFRSYMTLHTPVNCLPFQTFITKCHRGQFHDLAWGNLNFYHQRHSLKLTNIAPAKIVATMLAELGYGFLLNPAWNSHVQCSPLKMDGSWLEDDSFLLGPSLFFQGQTVVSCGSCIYLRDENFS